jgi:hypothetical protein
VLAKSMVYRGYDNVKSLMEFYQWLMTAHEKVVNSGFDEEMIREVVV